MCVFLCVLAERVARLCAQLEWEEPSNEKIFNRVSSRFFFFFRFCFLPPSLVPRFAVNKDKRGGRFVFSRGGVFEFSVCVSVGVAF